MASPAALQEWQLIGTRVRTARRQHGFTQRVLAEKAQVAFSTLQAIEVGRRGSRYDTLTKLAATLAVPIDQIVGGTSADTASLFALNADATLTVSPDANLNHEDLLIARAYNRASTEARQRVQQVLVIDEAARKRDPDRLRGVSAADRLLTALSRLRDVDARKYLDLVDAFISHTDATLQQQTANPVAPAPPTAVRKRR